MSVVLAADRLRLEIARRGWGNADLARAASVSAATITAATAGRPISPSTLRKIALALSMSEPVSGVDAILPPPASEGG
jgi:transcriptional regulator with XRE-family HTH domain